LEQSLIRLYVPPGKTLLLGTKKLTLTPLSNKQKKSFEGTATTVCGFSTTEESQIHEYLKFLNQTIQIGYTLFIEMDI
jgi:hypothetical protein